MSYFHKIGLMLFAAALASCVNKVQNGDSSSDTTEVTVPSQTDIGVQELDTLIGYVGDGTSMHNLEFLPLEGDTMEFELSDDVDRRADLMVGNRVAVVLSYASGGSPQVVATLNPDDVSAAIPFPEEN